MAPLPSRHYRLTTDVGAIAAVMGAAAISLGDNKARDLSRPVAWQLLELGGKLFRVCFERKAERRVPDETKRRDNVLFAVEARHVNRGPIVLVVLAPVWVGGRVQEAAFEAVDLVAQPL